MKGDNEMKFNKLERVIIHVCDINTYYPNVPHGPFNIYTLF